MQYVRSSGATPTPFGRSAAIAAPQYGHDDGPFGAGPPHSGQTTDPGPVPMREAYSGLSSPVEAAIARERALPPTTSATHTAPM